MVDQNATTGVAKAWPFFEKARRAAETGNFDYAIDMYVEGLRLSPESVFDGHAKLHVVALQRKEKGGKGPSMMERINALRPKRGQSPLDEMLNAELLFTKDPYHLPYAESMLKAAIAGEFIQTAKWIADLLFQINNALPKQSVQTYVLLKNSYSKLGQFDRALAACQLAVKIRPQDADLADEFKRLSAELTVARGKYDQEGDFRHSIKDREVQEKLQSQDSIIKTEDYRTTAVNDARSAFAADSTLSTNIYNLALALSEMEEENSENEAIEILENAYKTKGDFGFKDRAGQIKIRQLSRKLRDAKSALEANPQDKKASEEAQRIEEELNNVRLQHYGLCVQNYPTDMRVKYEYANCLLQNKQYDEAIPLFQEAQRDPRHKTSAMSKIGLAFFLKGWFPDAIDIFNQAIEGYEIKDDNTAKELRYNLGRAYEANGDTQKALEIYRRLAQLDFGYKDIRQRVNALRKKTT